MPLWSAFPVSAGTPVGSMGLLATTPGAVSTGYSWTYNTAAKAFPAYTPNVQSSAYVGNLLDLTQALRLTDGNALRVALENLRVFTENLAKQHNQVSLDLAAAGLISL
jgi:hypothetical protein